jgi:hypothetical protein
MLEMREYLRRRLNRHTGECRYPGYSLYWTPTFAGVTELMCLGVSLGSFFVSLRFIDSHVSIS